MPNTFELAAHPVDSPDSDEAGRFLRLPTIDDFPTTPRDRAIMQDALNWHERSLHSLVVFGLPGEQCGQYWEEVEKKKRATIERGNTAVQERVEEVGIL